MEVADGHGPTQGHLAPLLSDRWIWNPALLSLPLCLSLSTHTHTHTYFQTCKLGQRKAGTWPSCLHFNTLTLTPHPLFYPRLLFWLFRSSAHTHTHTVFAFNSPKCFCFWKLPWQNPRGRWDTMLMILFRHGNPSHTDKDAAHSSVLVFLFCERSKNNNNNKKNTMFRSCSTILQLCSKK